MDNNNLGLKDPKFLIQNIFNVLLLYKYFIFIFIVFSFVVSYALLLFVSDKYVTECSLLVTLGRENLEVPLTVSRGDLYSNGVRLEDINSEIQILSSRVILEELIDSVGPDFFYPPSAAPKSFLGYIKLYLKNGVKWLKKKVEILKIKLRLSKEYTEREKLIMLLEGSRYIRQEKESNVIVVGFEYSDKDLSTAILKELLSIYFEKRTKLRKNIKVKDFYANKAKAIKRDLDKLEDKRKDFLNHNNISSITEQRSFLLNKLTDFNSQIDESYYDLEQLDKNSIIADIKKNIDIVTETELPAESTLETVKQYISDASLQYYNTKYYYSNDSEVLQKLEIDIISYANLFKKLLQNKIKQLNDQISKINTELKDLNSKNDWINKIDREILILQNQYLDYSKRKDEAMISLELDDIRISNVIILSPPLTPIKPIAPARMKIVILSFILGFILSVIVVFLLEYFNPRIFSKDDFDDLDEIEVLGTLQIKRKHRILKNTKLLTAKG